LPVRGDTFHSYKSLKSDYPAETPLDCVTALRLGQSSEIDRRSEGVLENFSVRKVAASLGCVVALLFGTACETIPGPDELDEVSQFSTDLSLMELANTLEAEAARVEIALYRQGVVIKELEVKSQASLTDDERVEGRVVAVEVEEGGGYFVLNIEDLRIGFDENTQFSTRDKEGSIDTETALTRVRAALATNAFPAIEAMRPAPAAPQAPDDETFTAAYIRLLGEGEGRVLEMNINRDNLERNPEGFPDGWMTLLAREFEIRIREGITRLERERPDLVKERFGGEVEEVFLDRQAFAIKDGPEVRIIPGETEIRYEDGDNHRLPSLEAVKQALDEGNRVFTAGVGVVVSEDPHRLVAIAVVFEVEPPPVKHFDGQVESVDLDDSTVTLVEGPVVRITAETQIRFEAAQTHLLGSLEAVAEALEDGKIVMTAGAGVVVEEGLLLLEAVKIVFVIRSPPMKEFRGLVDEVNPTDSTVTLVGGTTIRVTAETEISFGAISAVSDHRLGSLEAVAEAVEAGRTVVAAGIGVVELEDTLVIEAKKIVFVLEPPHLIAFHGVVESVNLDAHTFTLKNGTVVRVNDETVVWFQSADVHSLRTLRAVAEALENGRVVVAAGVGKPDPIGVSNAEGVRLLAVKVAFYVVAPGIQHFEGTVVGVDIEDRSFTLDENTVVRVVEGTVIVHHNGDESIGSFDAVVRMFNSGVRIKAAGLGLLETSDPLVLIAVAVVFRV